MFVFDEPTIGLHPLDVKTLLDVFQALVGCGATVLVIEHDLDVIRNADYIIDMGPGGGEEGGRIVAVGGKRELIAPLSQQALDMGFDGLIIESHCNPDCAWSDASQQITPETLHYILSTLVLREEHATTENLAMLRREIDRIDNELLEVLNRRMRVCREIGRYKKEHSMPVVQAKRYGDIMNDRVKAAVDMHMGAEFMRTVLSAVHEESVRQQINILNGDDIKE